MRIVTADRRSPSADIRPVPSALDFGESSGAELRPEEFARVCRLLYSVCGINLQPGKEQLVKARLWKRVRVLHLSSYSQYLDLLESRSGGEELLLMVDSLTTNKTSFFRESAHFDFLRDRLRERSKGDAQLRIWCAGCSTGQEPYTLAITLVEAGLTNPREARILATDISARVLEEARAGVYGADDVGDIDRAMLAKYFRPQTGNAAPSYAVTESARRMIQFARLNLMEAWPMKGPFDFIFCRNVMIYFDKDTQQKLVRRFWETLRPGGFLLVGHSESLTGRADRFAYVQPATYQKQAFVGTDGAQS
jgi:chemotaxis protein methyltransferase CheR